MNFFWRYPATLMYIIAIVLINVGFVYVPFYHFPQGDLSIMDPIAGIIYLARDFSQRELGHKKVFIAMFIGAVISFLFSDPFIAAASVAAFIVGELIDWGLFSFTKKPFSQRLLLSAMTSAPIDTMIFLGMLSRLNILAFSVMTLAKILGIYLVWLSYFWIKPAYASGPLNEND